MSRQKVAYPKVSHEVRDEGGDDELGVARALRAAAVVEVEVLPVLAEARVVGQSGEVHDADGMVHTFLSVYETGLLVGRAGCDKRHSYNDGDGYPESLILCLLSRNG